MPVPVGANVTAAPEIVLAPASLAVIVRVATLLVTAPAEFVTRTE